MRTPNPLLAGALVALAGLAATTPALAAGEASGATSAALPMMGKAYAGRPAVVRPGMTGTHRWGQRYQGRWIAGWRAPGGWGAYRRPVYGYVLPRYWVQPSYYIANYSAYGFPAPAAGYGWSRYYDDAVMTDRYGRVYDQRSNVEWDRYDGGYDDRYDGRYDDDVSYGRDRRDDGVGGAVIGAVVGGIAGNRIAGRGNRTAGTLIGAGAGAVAGAIIDKAEDGGRRAPPPPGSRPRHGAGYDYAAGPDYAADYAHADDGVTYGGRWVGTWYGKDGTTYSGEYEGEYRGDARGVSYDAPPYDTSAYRGRPHWSDGSGPPPHGGPAYGGGGYVANGWYYPAPTITTVTVQPAMTTTTTTTTTYVTETVRARPAVRRKVRTCRCK